MVLKSVMILAKKVGMASTQEDIQGKKIGGKCICCVNNLISSLFLIRKKAMIPLIHK